MPRVWIFFSEGYRLLIELLEEAFDVGGEDDLGAAVHGFVGGGVVGDFGCELAVAAGFDAGGVDGGTVLEEELDDGGGAHDGEVPVVLDGGGAAVGVVVGVSFDHDVEGGVGFEDFGEFLDGVGAFFGDGPGGGGEHELVVHGDVDFAVFGLDVEAFVGEAEERLGDGATDGFKLTLFGLEFGAGGGFLCLEFFLLGYEFAALELEGLLLLLELFLLGLELGFFLVELFGACGEEVLCAVEVAVFAGHFLHVVLHGGVVVVAEVLDAAVEAVDGAVAAVLGGREVGVVGGEGVVLPCEGCVFFLDFVEFLTGELVLFGLLVVFCLEVLVLAEGDTGGEGDGGDGAGEEVFLNHNKCYFFIKG